MKRLSHAIWLLTLILAAYFLTGCSTINSTLDNGIDNVPGKRIQGSATVYKW